MSDSDFEELPDRYNVEYIVQYRDGEVRCLLCDCTLVNNYTSQSQKTIKQHIKGQNHKNAVVDDVLPDIRLYLSTEFNASTHYISEKCEGKVYCFLCRCYIPLTLTNIQEHLLGSRHSDREAVIEEIQNLDKETYSFEKQSQIADHMAKCEESFIYHHICICTTCNVKVQSYVWNVESHLASYTHIENEKQMEAEEEYEDDNEQDDDEEEDYSDEEEYEDDNEEDDDEEEDYSDEEEY